MQSFRASAKHLLRRLPLGLVLASSVLVAQAPVPGGSPDTDRDGLSDALEQKLLVEFLPTLMVASHDCATLPAEFKPGSVVPEAEAENATLYGQAFPAAAADGLPAVELHYYHLWRSDCGPHGHPLDTEHVSVLVQASGTDTGSAQWKALYWYAAAHENTVCDVSQIARASTLHAEHNGATVWISPGKHASYLSSSLCESGCGADRCTAMRKITPAQVINLGEPLHPMHRSDFIASDAWPLAGKMSASNFPQEAVARLQSLPETDIAWFHPGRHPVQGIIATSSSTEQALAASQANVAAAVGTGTESTGDALATGTGSTGAALSTATDHTGNALQKTGRHVRRALGATVRSVGRALHLDPKR